MHHAPCAKGIPGRIWEASLYGDVQATRFQYLYSPCTPSAHRGRLTRRIRSVVRWSVPLADLSRITLRITEYGDLIFHCKPPRAVLRVHPMVIRRFLLRRVSNPTTDILESRIPTLWTACVFAKRVANVVCIASAASQGREHLKDSVENINARFTAELHRVRGRNWRTKGNVQGIRF